MTIFIVGIFGIFVSVTYNKAWKKVDQRIMKGPIPNHILNDTWKHNRMKKATDPDFYKQQEFESLYPWLIDSLGEDMPVKYNDSRFIVWKKNNFFIVKDVTAQISKFRALQRILLIGGVIAALLSFVISKFVVHKALRDLHTLADSVKDIDVDNLHLNFDWSHLPQNDELAVISQSVDSMTRQLALQITDIKQFVANASHELRTPLMILRSSNELAVKTKEYETLIEKNIATISSMESMIQGLLELAQVWTLSKKEKVVVGTAVHDVVGKLAFVHKDKKITVTIDETIDTVIEALAWSFEHILSNIVDNAYKYTPEGGDISIVIKEKEIQISDTWSWLSMEQKELLWKPFWQADTGKGDDSWFGLWLTLVKRLCDVQGRNIDVKDATPQGTCFTVQYW